jgi:hypothetical protein
MISEEKIIVSLSGCFLAGFGVGMGYACGKKVVKAIGDAWNFGHQFRSDFHRETRFSPTVSTSPSRAEQPRAQRHKFTST